MDSINSSVNCDQLPTPSIILKTIDEIGLFKDLQEQSHNNPFDKTFKDAINRGDRCLSELLSRPEETGSLDTPQVVPNSMKDNYQNTYPMIEDDTDEIEIPIEPYSPRPENDQSKSESAVNEVIESTELHIQTTSNHDIGGFNLENNVQEIFCTEMPSGKKSINSGSQNVVNNVPVLHKFVISQSAEIENENADFILESFSDAKMLIENNVLILKPLKNAKIVPKPLTSESGSKLEVKQKLKKLLNSFQETNIPQMPVVNENFPEKSQPVQCFDKRERNRAAQKRCRMRKKNEIKALRDEVSSLRAKIAQLETVLLAHKDCSVTQAMLQKNVNKVTSHISRINGEGENH